MMKRAVDVDRQTSPKGKRFGVDRRSHHRLSTKVRGAFPIESGVGTADVDLWTKLPLSFGNDCPLPRDACLRDQDAIAILQGNVDRLVKSQRARLNLGHAEKCETEPDRHYFSSLLSA